MALQSSNRQNAVSVQHLRSPLTRVGYSLSSDSAHLLVLFSGRVGYAHDDLIRIDGPRIVWRPNDVLAELLADAGTRAVLVTIPRLALTRALPTTSLGEQMRQTLAQGLNFSFASPEPLTTLLDGLEDERQNMRPGAQVASAHYLALILVQLWRLARSHVVVRGHASQDLAERFVNLAGQHAREHWRVSDYARTLGVNRDRLGAAVRRATGHSPKGFLHRELTREANVLLSNTDMPVAQIAYRLGFNDPAYFTRFFNRIAGTSPINYRRTMKERPTDEMPSFAAWP